ncbi:unknown protein [Waddlia chondrophila 2032/99]|uniref:Uncharacterized protein n=1 Tax=Waddlia chondrophila 2032/99 TaxID=765953 RepID=F8LDE0_9BACT|nr:unknown protein [Waddlia chondrophila 2032/99]
MIAQPAAPLIVLCERVAYLISNKEHFLKRPTETAIPFSNIL